MTQYIEGEPMVYVDGFLLPVPKKNLAAYRRMASIGCEVWRDHGALDYKECVGDDVNPKFGLPFPKAMKLKPGEVPVFSWIVYKSKAHRNSVNKKVMKDPRLSASMDGKKTPFDMKRMCYGGFTVLVGF
jgi:uncharacterized protein YbaA (DUF1428 family)